MPGLQRGETKGGWGERLDWRAWRRKHSGEGTAASSDDDLMHVDICMSVVPSARCTRHSLTGAASCGRGQ
jgi:hypothetical protein